ncbi:MAG: chemotaxis protein CheX [bacterium]|nr:chemotaxis protein CheX [bacterium]
MTEKISSLKHVIFDIFGDMFFLFPDEYDDDELGSVDFPKDWIKYGLKITNESETFNLNFYFTPNQAKLMTENFLGEEAEEISEVIIAEALKEAANVIGGNLLNELDIDFHLGIPGEQPCEDSALLKSSFDKKDCILLNVEEEPFLAKISN